MAEKLLVLEDQEGKVLRAFNWSSPTGRVVRRGDTRRLEVLPSLEALEKAQIPFEDLGEISKDSIAKNPFIVGKLGHLRLIDNVEDTIKDIRNEKENDRRWYLSLIAVFVLVTGFLTAVFKHEPRTDKIEAELKQELVKIVKSIPPKPKVEAVPNIQNTSATPVEKNVVTKNNTQTLKRMGALAALGSLSKGSQKGGVDLGAVNTTAGPGLGGTAGSGGVQTSLYGKGIVSAPLGAGHNVQGAGGYGTQGKGGGKAGYGQLTMIGSSGAAAVPLVQEATAEAGLDMDAIAAVINRNQGQIRFCYEQGLQGDPSLSGRVAVNFTINGQGAVHAASIGSSSLASKIVEDCIMMRLKSWKFPLPQGGADVKVSYPFNLRRAGHG